MKKSVLIPALLFIILLTACGTPAPNGTDVPFPAATELPTEIPPACVSISSAPTPAADENSLFPPVSPEDHTIGLDTAQTTFIVYNDFKSQYSQYAAYVFSQMLLLHPQDMRVVMRNAPGDELSALALQAAEAADLQGKFWEMHNALYNDQQTWVSLTPEQFPEWLKNSAIKLGLDGEKFQSDMQSEAIVQKVKNARDFWSKLEKQMQEMSAQPDAKLSPPLILINGKPTDATALTNLPTLVDTTVSMNALIPRQFTECPPEVIKPGKEYIATLKTEKGDIVIQLLPDKAPLTVNSFVFLAQQGWYDSITFHRVLPGFVAQTGDPSGTGLGNPGYFINDEIDPALKYDKAGVVGMANSGPDTNGSQFFITYGPVPNLDGGYTIFGQVISGMDVLQELTARDPSGGKLLPPGDKLLTIAITEK